MPLQQLIRRQIEAAGGWLSFDRFMASALYAPQLGYYSAGSPKLGQMPQSGSDFVTAPELSPWFGKTLGNSVREALHQTKTQHIWEFGAGTGALALQMLQHLGDEVKSYTIVEVSAHLKAKQKQVLSAYLHKVTWADEWPSAIEGVVVGNEVLDAMPVRLLYRLKGVWHERGVVWAPDQQQLVWGDQITDARAPFDIAGNHDYLTETHPQVQAFIFSLAERLQKGAAFLIDYGFPEREYYHEQRSMGTLMCHQAHQSDTNPLVDVGHKDITAHVNFTDIALSAQNAGMNVLGYTSQAHFLINSGLLEPLVEASIAERAMAQKLIAEHEMGELFKVIALGVGQPWEPMGFDRGDRSHSL